MFACRGGCYSLFCFGGLHSAARVNILQLTVKLVGFTLAVVFLLNSNGGFAVANDLASQKLGSGTSPAYFNIFGNGLSTVLGFLISLVPAFIVSPGLLQKVFGAKD